MKAKHIAASLIFAAGAAGSARAAAFTAGDLAVFQAAASANNTTGSIIEINPSSANQAAVQTITINGATGGTALRFSGSATSTAYLSLSADRSLLTFTGANTTSTTSNANTFVTRGVGTLDSSGTFALATTYSGTNGQQTRSASTFDNSTWYVADQAGLYTNGATTASPTGNFRGMKAFGGVMYVGSSSASFSAVNAVSAATGGTVTGLPGLGASVSAFQDFYMVSSGSNGAAFDILYTVSATSNTAGTINKYSLVSGSWLSNGSTSTAFGGFSLAASFGGGSTDLFVTTGQGALTANSVIKVTDAGGYNGALSLGSSTTLFTAPAGTILKGIDFVPTAVAAIPEPFAAAALAGLATLGLAASRRRRNA